MLMIGPLVMAIIAPVAGRLADRYSPKGLAALGALCVMVSLLMATTVTMGTGLLTIIGILVAQGAGFALFSAPGYVADPA